MNKIRWLIVIMGFAILTLLPLPVLGLTGNAGEREIVIHARAFEYTPSTIHVQPGERVRLTLIADDVTHGLAIDGYELLLEAHPKDLNNPKSTAEFVATNVGRFRFRCTTVCGALHPFMIGELIVEPNTPGMIMSMLPMGIGLGGLLFLIVRKDSPDSPFAPTRKGRFELTSIKWIKWLLQQRWFQYVLFVPNLIGFAIVLLTGFFGTPIGSSNFGIIFVWIVWWAALIVFLIPLGGRFWCTVCPLPAPGEWLDHGAVIEKGNESPLSKAVRNWPNRLKNIWLQNGAFLSVAMFSAIILTRPLATGIVLGLFIVGAIILSKMYGRRVFCRYVCPVGGFIGLYSMVAPVELRVRDPQVCLSHKEKECIRGSAAGYGCPWMEYPGNLQRNAYCGLCTECLKTCTKDNVVVNLRPFGDDLFVDHHRLDEAYKAIIMLTCAAFYSAVFLGPWGFLKDWANIATLPGFLAYVALFLGANLIIVPLSFYVASWAAKAFAEKRLPSFWKASAQDQKSSLPSTRDLFIDLAYSLVPMGLSAWIAFTASFVMVNVSYAVPLISDPFGWGWNLLGTAAYPWTPYWPDLVPYVQAPILLIGLLLSLFTAYRILKMRTNIKAEALWAMAPVTFFLILVTMGFMRLYV